MTKVSRSLAWTIVLSALAPQGARAHTMNQPDDQTPPTSAADSQKKSANQAVSDSSVAPPQAEIVVTAQKRAERLQDVPVPVTALSAQSLIESNLLTPQDYYQKVPGLNSAGRGAGGSALAIRGLTSGGNPTVGVSVDDVPYGSSTALGGGGGELDLDPSDLSQIEILRGPQGTLYGASSLGGLLKYITVDPDLTAIHGRFQSGVSGVYNGSALGYNFRAAITTPVNDQLGFRVSGFSREDPGYIDDPEHGREGVNREEVVGGRASLIWKPSSSFSIKLAALVQDDRGHGTSNADPSIGNGLEQNEPVGTGPYHRKNELYSAVVNDYLGRVTLTSISGYGSYAYNDSISLNGAIDGNPLALKMDRVIHKFSQELRANVPVGEYLNWLVGAFYTHEHTSWIETFPTLNPASGSEVESFGYATFPTTYTEYAAFTDVTFKFTPRFDVQFGGRYSVNHQGYKEEDTGPFFGDLVNPLIKTSDHSFTYLVTPRYRVSDHFMVYARAASGYRPGGPNAGCAFNNYPCNFRPDTTKNYEVGTKGSVLNKMISFDASVYYIDWKDIQLLTTIPSGTGSFFGNASRATSKGVELSVDLKPVRNFTVSGWVAFNVAKLTEGFPVGSPQVGRAGDLLPFSEKFSMNVSAEKTATLGPGLEGFVGSSVSYVGKRYGPFPNAPSVGAPPPLRDVLPAYGRVDLHAGIRKAGWDVSCFVNNLTNSRGVLQRNPFNPAEFEIITPRTVGVNVAKSF